MINEKYDNESQKSLIGIRIYQRGIRRANRIIIADVLKGLGELEDNTVNCCVTSPPYYRLRDYKGIPAVEWPDGWVGQLGHEKTVEEYIAHVVGVFREVSRVLRKDGTVWLNIADSYAGIGNPEFNKNRQSRANTKTPGKSIPPGLKRKDLCGIPWRVALALQDDGWWLRSDIIWQKTNCMPESVKDRPTRSHEHIFLLTKSARYWYDAEAIREKGSGRTPGNKTYKYDGVPGHETKQGILAQSDIPQLTRSARDVWTFPSGNYKGPHFSTFPAELPKRCILAGCPSKVCAVCGSPWVNEVEKGFTAHDGETKTEYPKGTTSNRLALLRQAARERGGEYQNARKVLGLRPTCACNAETRPGVVLDPFAGSGTTGMVAKTLGRNYILIETNSSFETLIEKRLASAQEPRP